MSSATPPQTPPDPTKTTPTPEETAAAAAKAASAGQDVLKQIIEVTVDGQKQQVTVEEAAKRYEHATAASKRMEDASNLRKQAENDIQLATAIRTLAADPTNLLAAQTLAQTVGMSDADTESLMDFIKSGGAAAATAGAAGASGNAAELPPIEIGDLSPELQALLKKASTASEQSETATKEQTRTKVFSECDIRVDSDPVLATIPVEARAKVLPKLKQFVRNEVQRRVGLLHEPWPDVLSDIMQDARDWAGMAGNQGGAPDSSTTGIGPAATMSSRPLPAEPPQRVSVNDPGYRKNALERLQHHLQKALADKQK